MIDKDQDTQCYYDLNYSGGHLPERFVFVFLFLAIT